MKTTTYTVKYKMPGWLFWRSLKNVSDDGILFQQVAGGSGSLPMRYFHLIGGNRVELPMTMMFSFDPRRFQRIEESMRRDGAR